MGKILPLLLALAGTGAGIGAGIALRPTPEEIVELHPCGPPEENHSSEEVDVEEPSDEEASATNDFVRLNNQFVVSVVNEGEIVALVVLSLSIEVVPGNTEIVYQQEPRLRDNFLQVMFNHANIGGFDGAFTNSAKMGMLRDALLEVAQRDLGDIVVDVLIQDVVRQNV